MVSGDICLFVFFFALAVLLVFSMCFVIFLSWVLCISKKKPPLSVFVDWLSTEEDFNYQSDQRFWAPLKLSLKEGNAFSLGFSYNFPIREINQFFFFFQKLIIFCFVSCLSALFKLMLQQQTISLFFCSCPSGIESMLAAPELESDEKDISSLCKSLKSQNTGHMFPYSLSLLWEKPQFECFFTIMLNCDNI